MIHIVLYMQNGYFHRMLSFYSNIRHIFYIRTDRLKESMVPFLQFGYRTPKQVCRKLGVFIINITKEVMGKQNRDNHLFGLLEKYATGSEEAGRRLMHIRRCIGRRPGSLGLSPVEFPGALPFTKPNARPN